MTRTTRASSTRGFGRRALANGVVLSLCAVVLTGIVALAGCANGTLNAQLHCLGGVGFTLDVTLGPCEPELPEGYALCAQIALSGYSICEYCNPMTGDKYISLNCETECYRRVLSSTPSHPIRTDVGPRALLVEGYDKLPCDEPETELSGSIVIPADFGSATVAFVVPHQVTLPPVVVSGALDIDVSIDGTPIAPPVDPMAQPLTEDADGPIAIESGQAGQSGMIIVSAGSELVLHGPLDDVAIALYLLGVTSAEFDTMAGPVRLEANTDYGLIATYLNGRFLRVDPVVVP